MKYFVIFMLVCVALAAAAPQYITGWPGLVHGGLVGPHGTRTLVAGPTVINGLGSHGVIGGRIITDHGLINPYW